MKYFITWCITTAIITHSVTYNQYNRHVKDRFGRVTDIPVVDTIVKTDTVYGKLAANVRFFDNYDSSVVFYRDLRKASGVWGCDVFSCSGTISIGGMGASDVFYTPPYQPQWSNSIFKNVIIKIKINIL